MPDNPNAITRLRLENFTAFRELDIRFSPGLNVLIGENGTGKTHVLHVLHSAVAVTRLGERRRLAVKLCSVFMPYEGRLGRLVRRQQGSSTASVLVSRADSGYIRFSFTNHAKEPGEHAAKQRRWFDRAVTSAFIPVKEILANAPGFRSLYAERVVHFEETYADILDRAYIPVPRGAPSKARQQLMRALEKHMQGKVKVKDESFFLRSRSGDLEFSLLAEGLRKLALLWTLINNGTLLEGAILFWDEPEANLNPSVIGAVVEVILELQRMGVQVFIATHSYVVLRELDLRLKPGDSVRFHALFRDKESGDVKCSSTDDPDLVEPNAILDTFGDLYNRAVKRALGGNG